MSYGIEIVFKNSEKDWVDPVSEDPEEIDGYLIVGNDVYSYRYDLEIVDSWSRYELHPCCSYDARGRHSISCINEE